MGRGSGRGGRSRTSGGGAGGAVAPTQVTAARQAQINRRATIGSRLLLLGAIALLSLFGRRR